MRVNLEKAERAKKVADDRTAKELKKLEDDRKEFLQAKVDRATLDARKVPPKKATVKKITKKQERALASAKKLNERVQLAETKERVKNDAIEARRKELVLDGITPITLDDDEVSAFDEDDEWDCDEWEVVDHAVDWKTAKANFKLITGKRAGDGETASLWMWGQRQALLLDGFNETKLDRYITERCKHPVYNERQAKVARTKLGVVRELVPRVKRQCKHSSFELGLSYHADPEVNPGWCMTGKFLFGIECAGCKSPFVQKALPPGDGKTRGEPQVPAASNGVYCCNNLRFRNGSSPDGCDHAYCKQCWDEGLLRASVSGTRPSRRNV